MIDVATTTIGARRAPNRDAVHTVAAAAGSDMLDPDPDRKPLPQTVDLWNNWKNHQAHWGDPTAPDMPMPGEEFRHYEASEPGQPPNVEQEEREPRKKKKEKTMKSLVARHIGRPW